MYAYPFFVCTNTHSLYTLGFSQAENLVFMLLLYTEKRFRSNRINSLFVHHKENGAKNVVTPSKPVLGYYLEQRKEEETVLLAQNVDVLYIHTYIYIYIYTYINVYAFIYFSTYMCN